VDIIRARLQAANPGLDLERRIIKTSGDKFLDVSLAAAGGKGLFTKEIEDQLLAGAIDVAVHSLKDLPTQLPAGLTIGAVLERADARDVLISHRYQSVDELPTGARVGTSSIRRKAQLLARRPDLRIAEIRGNVGTRIQQAAELDGIILAAAGLQRLGLTPPAYPLDMEVMLPAVGQGIIACEIREGDATAREVLATINDASTRACAEAERAFLRAIGGGCQLPFAAYAHVAGAELHLTAARFEPVMQKTRIHGAATEAVSLGAAAANRLQI
jgi:hydroxymethylbilane synthase